MFSRTARIARRGRAEVRGRSSKEKVVAVSQSVSRIETDRSDADPSGRGRVERISGNLIDCYSAGRVVETCQVSFVRAVRGNSTSGRPRSTHPPHRTNPCSRSFLFLPGRISRLSSPWPTTSDAVLAVSANFIEMQNQSRLFAKLLAGPRSRPSNVD